MNPETRTRLLALLDEMREIILADAIVIEPGRPPEPLGDEKGPLTQADYEAAALALGFPTSEGVAVVKAIADVESSGKAFGPDGRPIVRFEKHIFSRLTGGRYDDTHGGVSGPQNNAEQNAKTQAERWAQLEYASRLDGAGTAAYASASYGMFQIMGFNWKLCGYPDLGSFLAAMETTRGQLDACIRFIKGRKLDVPLRKKQWLTFAKGYNGPQQQGYDIRLAQRFAYHLERQS